MAENLTIDFLHNYILKEVRTSDPIAYLGCPSLKHTMQPSRQQTKEAW